MTRLDFATARHPRLQLLAAAAAALFTATGPARAQYFDYEDSVFTVPTNAFPIDLFSPSIDLQANTLYVGGGAAGSFSAFAGSTLQAASLILGSGGSGDGTFSVAGLVENNTSALVRLTGTGARLQVGNWGEGLLTVSAGAVLDGAGGAAACGTACYSYVGTSAGSKGRLTVTGAGSEVRLLGLSVGLTNVFTTAGGSSFDLGTPGGTTDAFVDVLDGGKLLTQRSGVANNLAGPNGNGQERANGTVLVSGAGSQWVVTRNSADNTAALLGIGNLAGADGLVRVEAGGKLQVDGNLVVDGAASSGPNDGINVGSNGKGTLVVTGSGSTVISAGFNPFINVGANNSLGDGSFEVLAGATASTLYVTVGRDGGTGKMLIDGANSMLTQSGVGINQAPPAAPGLSGTNGAAGASIGRNNGAGGGTGTVTVSRGGQWIITDGGGDGRTAQNNPAITLGRGENSHGTLIITGAGSKVEVVGSTLNPPAGVGDNYNPFVGVGYDNPTTTTGTLEVSDGGKLLLTGNAKSTADNPRGTSLNIGGRSSSAGTGTATVTGAGSQIVLSGNDTSINVGRSAGSTGTFSILSGATASAVFLVAGRDGATGTMVLDGVGSKLSLSGQGIYSSGGIGPSVGLVGWGGTGYAFVSDGAEWTITDGFDTSALPSRGPALYIGVTSGATGGTGTLAITGAGSKVELVGTSINPLPGAADNFNPTGYVGNGEGSTGTVVIGDGGKLILTGNALSTPSTPPAPSIARETTLNIGGSSDTAVGGFGTVTVSGPGSELRLRGADTFIAVGRNGTGVLNLDDRALLVAEHGGMNLGRGASGVGLLIVDNSVIEFSGQYTGTPTIGSYLSIGNLGGNGTARIDNNSLVTITNLGTAGASLNLGGTARNPLGTGTLFLSGGSKINVVAAPGLASATIGRDGTGTATLAGIGTEINLGDGTLNVGQLATGVGTLSIGSGAKVLVGVANIGGSSDVVPVPPPGTGTTGTPGGDGTVTVAGSGSELIASGATAFIGVGRSGIGELTVSNGGKVTATAMSIGRGIGGNGTLTLDGALNGASLVLSGQQTAGNLVGANLSIGLGQGSGKAVIKNGATVNISNLGSAGANLVLGGSSRFPLGTGELELSGGSQITLSAAAGLGAVTIGNDGRGKATISGASSIDVGDGSVYVARQAASSELTLSGGSTLTAGFVGIGVSAKGDGVTQSLGGTATLKLDNSTIRTAGFELGAGSTLTGDGGTIEINPSAGAIVIGGTVEPGNSPGRMRFRCKVIMLQDSRIVLEVLGSGDSYAIDELIFDRSATFDLASAQIEFKFLGDTNPNQFADMGGMNLDNFFRSETGNTTTGLSEAFVDGASWSTVVDTAAITATSTKYDFTEFSYSGDGNITLTAVPVPEPSTWGLMFFGLAAVGAFARRRQATATSAI